MIRAAYLIIGGAIGTVARYSLSGLVHRFAGVSFPYGTFIVNMSGCFLIGFLAALADKKFLLSTDLKLLLTIGFCGAFTTFSTLIFESDNLLKSGEFLKAFLNIFLSVIIGLIIYRIGSFLGESL